MAIKAKHIKNLWKTINGPSTAGSTGNVPTFPPPGSYQFPNSIWGVTNPSSMLTAYTTSMSGLSALDIALLYALFSRPQDPTDIEFGMKVMTLIKNTKVSFIHDLSFDYSERVLFQRKDKNIICVDPGEFSTLYCEEISTPDTIPQKYSHKFYKVENLIAWINDTLSKELTKQDKLVEKIQKLCTT